MKQKTHSGAKKRLHVTGSGKKVKKKCVNKRHLLAHKSSKLKRQLGKARYVHTANEYQVSRLLVIDL